MKKCILLSMDQLDDFECYDSLAIEPLAQLGWHAEEVSWRDIQVNWNDYEAVIIRSPWDYQDDSEAFLSVLEKVEQSSAVLANSLETVKWNINKNYLAELQQQGVMIVPSLWDKNYDQNKLNSAFESFGVDELIIKPCVSANADDTFRLKKDDSSIDHQKLESLFENREFMFQPFMSSVINEGEFSLFYFNGEYSHAILKTPKTDDFRVQEEHGGQLIKIEPDPTLLSTAKIALSKLPQTTLYARLDFVRLDNQFALMEAELIEPSLYFNMDKESPARFAKAFVNFMGNV